MTQPNPASGLVCHIGDLNEDGSHLTLSPLIAAVAKFVSSTPQLRKLDNSFMAPVERWWKVLEN